MVKKKGKNKISDKMIGILMGMTITFSIIVIVGAVSALSRANGNLVIDNMMENDMPMMHSMMMGGDSDMNGGMMECMKIMNDATSDKEITEEEMNKMIQEMDKDGDGLCDYCGMSVEHCRKMMFDGRG